MSRTTRLWVVVVPAALALGVASFTLMAVSDHLDGPVAQASLTALTGGSFIAAGLMARTRRPLNRTGLLLIAVGFTWFVGSGLMGSDNSWVWTVGVALSAIPAGFLIHLLLAYPTGRLQSHWERFLVVTGYVLVVVGNVNHLPFDRDPLSCAECPNNAFLVTESNTAASIAAGTTQAVAVVFLLAVLVTLFNRWSSSSPTARRPLTPVFVVGGATLFLFAVSVGTQSLSSTFSNAVGWTAMVVLIGVPFLFLWGLLQSRLARADISRALAEEPAGGVQERMRQMLRDPTAELLYPCREPERGYIDVHGRLREAVSTPGRAVTIVERNGRQLAAILHDEALLEEPELLEQVAAAVALEVERDKSLFALQASERRSRALIDAMPDNMFRISADGVFLDIQENPEWSKTRPVHAKVGSSIYDYPVPRDLIERVMFAGKLALQTGELQTIEWQLGSRQDNRHQEGRFMRSGENEFFLVVRDVTARKQQELEQAALHRVALAVASEASTEQIFDLVSEEVARVLGAQASNLVRYEPGGEYAVIVGRWSEPGAESEPIGHRYKMKGAASHMVYETGRPIRLELGDGKVTPGFAEHMSDWGVNSIVAAPINVAGRPWGAVAAWLNAPDTFSAGTEDRMGAFTRLVSLAVANEEARSELAASRARLVSAGDEERRRLERNLHDGAQQRLVSLSLSLRLAQGKLASDPRAATELLSAAKLELDVALEELRELARGIHPAVLTERGLGPALESLADRAVLPVELDIPLDGRLPKRVEAAAYYVVSEALANVAKYAQASEVNVRVAHDHGLAVVEVVDDGVGGADPQRGSGLRGLNDRIEALEGALIVDSRPGEGTTIRAEIPLGEALLQDTGQPPTRERESMPALDA
jgi:signal transduction histidine kinase